MSANRATVSASGAEIAKAREHLAGMAARLEVGGATGEDTSARIFDLGLPGLEFFRTFGPSYAKLDGKSFDFDRDIADRYNAQREIAFGRVRADAERLGRLFTAMTDTDLDFRNSSGSLFDYWSGPAADSAKTTMTGFLASADSAWGRIEKFAATLTEAVREAERIVLDKTKAVLDLATTTIEDLSASDVSLLVELATAANAGSLTDAQLGAAGELLDLTVIPQAIRANAMVFGTLRNGAGDRLDRIFTPAYETRYATFDTACTSAQALLDTAWNTVRTALGDLTDQAEGAFGQTRPQAASTKTTETTVAATPGPTVPAATVPTPAPAPAPMPTPAPAPTPEAAPQILVPAPSAPQGPDRNITNRLTPAPTDDPGTPAGQGQDPAPTGMGSSGQADVPVDSGAPVSGAQPDQHQRTDPQQPAEAPAPAATPAVSGSPGYFSPPRFAQGGGDGVHERKVPLKGKPVSEKSPSAAPDGVIGEADDPAAYNEAQTFDDYLPRIERPVPVEEEEPKKEPVTTVWRLNKDGKVEAVTVPAATGKNEKK